MKLSMAAAQRLLKPSEAYFERGGSQSVNRKKLRIELEAIIDGAIQTGEPGDEAVRIKINGRFETFLKNPRQRRRKIIREGDVRTAMDRATCHYLWFC
jgi:hypothetical protein